MKISVKNLGVLKQAEFELGELTLICGGNNTGKTYATYALFGFLQYAKDLLKVEIPNQTVEALLRDGVTRVDIEPYAMNMETDEILRRSCLEYTQHLPRIFAAQRDHFKDTTFQVSLEPEAISSIKSRTFERRKRSAEVDLLSLSKDEGEKDLVISLLMDKRRVLPPSMIEEVISDGIIELLFDQFFPRSFIASTERTGAAIFREELNFSRRESRLLDEIIRAHSSDFEPMDLSLKSYQGYPMPVENNIDFIRRLETVAKEDSFLVEKYPQVLNDFADIIGGEYIAGSNDTIYFKPAHRQLKLTMDESSSAVRSLLDIGFYLRHLAEPGDLLMVDEPELNLHPENQRRIARLFAQLVNLGIRVFATTHSDYIVKELNTLIMLKQDKPYLKQIAAEEGYQSEELIAAEKIRLYIAEEESLVPANIDPALGIEAHSFDETINKMNEIQEAIAWGGDG